MPYFSLTDDIRLYYEDQGSGQPLILLPGWSGSSRAFRKQIAPLSQRYRVIALDPRGTGRSSKVHDSHTVAGYARDLRALLHGLGVKDGVFVGWSMGAMIIWDFIKQFPDYKAKATVIIDQMASDYKWPDWPFGFFDLSSLTQLIGGLQTDQRATCEALFKSVFKESPCAEDLRETLEDAMSVPASIAGVIAFDQTVQDYRPMLSSITVPTLPLFWEHGDRWLRGSTVYAGAYAGRSPGGVREERPHDTPRRA